MLQGTGQTSERARRLRRDMSLPEVLLWNALRLRPGGLKFRRQHPSGPYVADFFCHEARLVLEIDGAHHGEVEQARFDRERDGWFASRNFTVLRIPAHVVLRNLEDVVRSITAAAATARTLYRPADEIPPHAPHEGGR